MISSRTNTPDDDVVIVSSVRTPLTRSRKGGLADVPPHELLQTVLSASIQQAGIQGSDIDDVCVGNVLMPPSGYATLKMAAVTAGIECPLQTINRQCASSLQAISTIANSIQKKEISVGIGAGVESMSQTPMNSMKLPKTIHWDLMNRKAMDCLLPMGVTSDTVAVKYGLDREELDAFAVNSHHKAFAAVNAGKFRSEIVPVRGVSQDDGIRPTSSTRVLAKLKPAFTPQGVTTAGNSSQTTDGAAAVVLTTRRVAVARDWPVQAVWRGYAIRSVPAHVMGIGPVVAIPAVVKQAGLDLGSLDVIELNEAFASQALYCCRELKLDTRKVNRNGGAIALGHPLGATGARMVATCIQELYRSKGKYGAISMCVGTGMGAAAVIEIEAKASL